MTTFTHLHLHSDRSALDAIIKIPELIPLVRELGMSSVAVTDHGVVSAAVQLFKETKKEKDKEGNILTPIKPLIGVELYLSVTDDHTLTEATPDTPKQACYHLVALAKNAIGVSQLYELSSIGYLEGFYYKPRVSLPLIEKIGKDLIILGGCGKGPVSWNVVNNHPDIALKWAERLQETFKGRVYLETMDHGLEWQRPLNKVLRSISKKLDLPWVPTNDAHFLKREDHYIHSIMMCLQLKQKLEDLTMSYPPECYVKSPAEMIELFGEEACKRTVEIAEQINIELDLGNAYFTEFISQDDDT